MRAFVRLVSMVLACVAGVPAIALAQGSIAGVVKDPSGAVLPGVTVEAASPALIEKVRSVATDGTGQYQIIDLRPGTYTVTFTLSGFQTFKREGIELTGSFAATVNAEMTVGAVNETVVVTGESPIVDLQSAAQQRVVQKDLIDAIPAGRSHQNFVVLIPGMTGGQNVGGTNTLNITTFTIHGSRASDQRVMVDGLVVRNVGSQGNLSNLLPDMGATQEVAIDYAAGSADTAFGGVEINYIPQTGGNTYKGSFFGTYVNNSFQGNNYTPELKAAGLTTPNSLFKVYDFNPSGGGPILKDKLWLYLASRWQANETYVAGLYANLNAGDPTKWTYAPDLNNRGISAATQRSYNGRMTWQATPRNKFSLFYDNQPRRLPSISSTISPEASSIFIYPENQLVSVSWTSPVTNRLLLEARAGFRHEHDYNPHPAPGDPYYTLIPVVEQTTGLLYRGKGVANPDPLFTFTDLNDRVEQIQTSLSYVTGAHSFKVGFDDVIGYNIVSNYDNAYSLTYRFNNGIPNQITERSTPTTRRDNLRAELDAYVQDKWRLNRLTLNMGVRFEYYNNGFDQLHLGPGNIITDRDLTLPATDFNSWKDFTPRLGAVYDLFGNGKTALKASASRYTIAGNPSTGNPISRIANTVTRTWTDSNGNFAVDCDVPNPQQQDLRASGGDFCGTVSDINFGKATTSTNFDPAQLVGWGVRPYSWEFSAGVQHQLAQRIGVDVGYFRRIYGNFSVIDNQLVSPSDFSPFSITAPLDPRLPGGGGYVISGLYNLNPNKVGLVNNLSTDTNNFGNQIEHWNGVDVNLNARITGGVVFRGGFSTGRTSTDNCGVVAAVPESALSGSSNGTLYCHVDTAFQTQVKMLGTYTVPRVDVQLAATFQSLPGPPITATYNAPNALVQSSLGRPLSGGAANVPINLVAPGTIYGERSNQVDFRITKAFNVRRTRTAINLDLYNLLNANPVLTLSPNFAIWQSPTSIMDARLFKISAQFNF